MVTELLITDKDHEVAILIQQARDTLFIAYQKELSKYGISATQATALFIINACGNNVSISDITRWVRRKHHSVSTLLSRMEQQGLITKKKSKQGKNATEISLTAKGRDAYAQSCRRESIHKVMSTFSEEERQQLISNLRIVRDEAYKICLSEPPQLFP
jgi:DNA-binding MarR family transcriptional regulator